MAEAEFRNAFRQLRRSLAAGVSLYKPRDSRFISSRRGVGRVIDVSFCRRTFEAKSKEFDKKVDDLVRQANTIKN